jgi:hypothetical protein
MMFVLGQLRVAKKAKANAMIGKRRSKREWQRESKAISNEMISLTDIGKRHES